ncbi:N-acetylglucosamine kinase [Nonomuraea jabiensis]|uniref:N-acetylglucosamine kinase-like BadF-type ATPase n=1 Tax=Nonomuraea jabiensis TaxID=882448 RepID=A0A7W9G6X8_9ACTN|nr:BadF/BadG/BcrA/BcrD ATPase family protein [Nonomuraea jabiensis]MBB5778267.1 N-acetylglucosamine kinase-like BadF-type ATPase [Nonomuraea jabiensis]
MLVLGVDAGGTSSRAALFTVDGAPVGRGHAPGANPVTLGMDQAGAHLTAAVQEAGSASLPHVSAVVLGLAGNPGACRELAARVLRPLLPQGPPVRVVGDTVTAFAAGTAAPSGTVLISGTGAIAAKITNHEQTATADGYGWLFGDEGSSFWLGHAAARTTIHTLATTGPLATHTIPDPLATARPPSAPTSGDGRLVALVVRQLLPEGVGEDPVAQLAAAVHARPPLALAELAPLVSQAAEAGDPVAQALVAEAAARLASTAAQVHEPGLPIVLAGGVLTPEGPVRRAVHDLLPDAVTAGDTADGAAWLAARELLPQADAQALHAAFTKHPDRLAHRTSRAALP